ncbi:hypothetical protein OIE62_13455 [Streptomyces scopuliridis]|uniref:Uncharacterized protein n=1 Tax=Streptomyces scopuliridis TaxID=452529 RepID=A0ACD4ZQH4_9ACTN|nr:hypothetical protein [Streptomyces scopuliridis]WSC00454.1 hypothetical protein OG835_27940 [Streptomyces scopuliridis]WSC05934.1 hypothetical protein OIE62_13455 [Streptomyces scopuliridis]
MPPHSADTASTATSTAVPADTSVSDAAPPAARHALGALGVEQAEAALVEHYTRLVRLAYLVLPPSLGRNRRVLTAHALVQRSLPRGRTAAVAERSAIPAQSGTEGAGGRTATGAGRNPGYAYVRERVLRQALDAGRPLRRLARPRRAQLPPLLPHVWGLRLFPRSGGADELALDQRLSGLSGPARAAFALRGLELLTDEEVRRLLHAAGAEDTETALSEAADAADQRIGTADPVELLRSPEFDPCSLQARPTDLMRRRQYGRTALAAGAALLVCGTLLGLPGGGWGPDDDADPAYGHNAAVASALDPVRVRRIAPAAWRTSARTDFSVWPARGPLAEDRALLGRALRAWAAPGASVQISATPATPSGPPMGSPQLLYAGTVDAARVVLFHDGLRVVRYAEPAAGGGDGVAALDFARVDGANAAAAGALVVGRSDGNVRYLTAPWVRGTAVRDLLDPAGPARPLRRDADGVTDPLASPAMARDCRSWDTLSVRDASDGGASPGDSDGTNPGSDGATDRLLTDLGELTPARLTSGPPSAPGDVSAPADRAAWARTACLLPAMRSHGVRSVNSWPYARQPLPESHGTATWLCTRAETWRGPGSRVLAQFQAPSETTAPGAVAARAEHSPACGARESRVLAGVLWKSRGGKWYVLAAGSGKLGSVEVSGGVRGKAPGNLLAVRAEEGAQAELYGRTPDGTRVDALR